MPISDFPIDVEKLVTDHVLPVVKADSALCGVRVSEIATFSIDSCVFVHLDECGKLKDAGKKFYTNLVHRCQATY